jgi:hypothetical protein
MLKTKMVIHNSLTERNNKNWNIGLSKFISENQEP